MADVNKLVFSIIRFLEDQKTAGNLSDEGVEGLEGMCLIKFPPQFTLDPSSTVKC